MSDTAANLQGGSPVPLFVTPIRCTRQGVIRWGSHEVTVGGNAPVRVQSMTNTDTADAVGTAIQVKELALAGSELVRITVNNDEAAKAVPYIREQLDRMGVPVPLIGDFHYNGHRLLTDHPACAEALSKYRINPGNVGRGDKGDRQFAQMVEIAARHGKHIRIGVNWGSLDQDLLARLMDENAQRTQPWDAKQVMYEALITSAVGSAQRAEQLGLPGENIILSCKVSAVQDLIAVYQALAQRCDYALPFCFSKALATPSASRSRHSRASRARRRWWWGWRFFRPWACARSCRPSPPARGAVAPPAPPSRNSPSKSMTTCAPPCRHGASATRALKA